ncbi:hypothetical protein DRN76_01230 [Methanosarcinales archaeon]|nr:MAG: hypothetical protein DRN76_01230 [Methanosarcinales archaeon]
MGFSVSATIAVLFIVFMGVGAVGFNMVSESFFSVQNALADRNKLMYDRLNTDINILNHSVNGSNLTLMAENTGTTVIEPVYLNALVDGKLVDTTSDDTIWFPEKTLNITMAVQTGEHRIKIVTGRGTADYYTVNLT